MVKACIDRIYVPGTETFCSVYNGQERFDLGQGVVVKKTDGETLIGGILHVGIDSMLVTTDTLPRHVKYEDIAEMRKPL